MSDPHPEPPPARPCHAEQADHPNHRAEISRLKRIKGQLDGIERMIEEGRYCPDILVQTRAVTAADATEFVDGRDEPLGVRCWHLVLNRDDDRS